MVIKCCPKCGCTELYITEKGYSVKKGLLGIAAFGVVGGLFGLHGNKRILYVCTNCGKQFTEPAQKIEVNLESGNLIVSSPVQHHNENGDSPQNEKNKGGSVPPVVTQRQICKCGAYNSIYAKECFSCGEPLDITTSAKVPQLPQVVVTCACGINNALTHKYCIGCGAWLDYSALEKVGGKISYEQQECRNCGQDTPKASRKVHFCAHCGKGL
ncbi:MAG: hypothetical protein Q4E59_05625 [Bacteroidales bacterium]|nr:hypothetical protein [Bacteroidales bacterium]